MSGATDSRPHEVALRHIFTSAPEEFSGESGFQTVACADVLRRPGLLPGIERQVECYSSAAAEEWSCRQLAPLPETRGAYALTVFTPLADSPDGRAGNFWAETLVVPGRWLELGGWDAAAAFGSLAWWGPRALEDLPRNLGPESLTTLQPGPLPRLARLVELVPREQLGTLLLALVQQSRGLLPLRVLETQGAFPGDLEELVMLLPLVVPPACRTYRDGEQRRCLSLRTRSPLRGMSPIADVTGYPAAAAERLEAGLAVDLSGRLPAPVLDDRFGRYYVQWLQGILQDGRWDELAAVYEKAEEWPGAAFFSKLEPFLRTVTRPAPRSSSTLQKTRPKQVDPMAAESAAEIAEPGAEAADHGLARTPPPGVSVDESLSLPPIRARQEAWRTRNEMEGALWEVLEIHRVQLGRLVAELQRDFAAELMSEGERLRREVTEWRQLLEGEVSRLERDIKGAGQSARRRSSSVLRELEDRGASLEKLSRRVGKLEAHLEKLERASSGTHDKLGPALVPAGEQPIEREVVPAFPKLALDRKWLRRRRWVGIAAGGTFALALAAATILFSPDSEQVPVHSGWKREQLVQRARFGDAATRLLAQAAAQHRFAPRAHGLMLALALHRGLGIDGTLDCALVKAALRPTNPRLLVNGVCAAVTEAALNNASKDDCCRRFQTGRQEADSQKLRHCYLSGHLKLGVAVAGGQSEACFGASPWRQERIWTTNEALRALALFRYAAAAVDDASEADLAKALRGLDPARNASLGASLADATLTIEEAESVLELSWAVLTDEELQLDRLSNEELDRLGQQVEGFVPVPAPATTGRATRGRVAGGRR